MPKKEKAPKSSAAILSDASYAARPMSRKKKASKKAKGKSYGSY